MVTAAWDFAPLYQQIAVVASAVATWAQHKAQKPADPVDDLMARLRRPYTYGITHPLRTISRFVSNALR